VLLDQASCSSSLHPSPAQCNFTLKWLPASGEHELRPLTGGGGFDLSAGGGRGSFPGGGRGVGRGAYGGGGYGGPGRGGPGRGYAGGRVSFGLPILA